MPSSSTSAGRDVHRGVPIKQLDIKHIVPPETKTVFANQVVVQCDRHDAFIQFFEIRPPILLGSEAERVEQLGNLDAIEATCVARVTIAPSRLPSVIEALTRQYESFLSAQEVGQSDDSDR